MKDKTSRDDVLSQRDHPCRYGDVQPVRVVTIVTQWADHVVGEVSWQVGECQVHQVVLVSKNCW